MTQRQPCWQPRTGFHVKSHHSIARFIVPSFRTFRCLFTGRVSVQHLLYAPIGSDCDNVTISQTAALIHHAYRTPVLHTNVPQKRGTLLKSVIYAPSE